MNISDLVPWRSNRNKVAVQRESDDYPQRPQFSDISQFFDDFFRGFDMTPFDQERWGALSPRIDLAENDREFRVTAELPGIEQEDIDVSLTRDVLTIKGEKKQEQEEEGRNYYRMERSYGRFQRSIPLPQGMVDADNVDAAFKNGVLTITLPKLPEAQQTRKRIAVK